METQKRKRKRIYPENKDMGNIAIVDEIAFVQNCASPNARKVVSIDETFQIDIWEDKHYHLREQHGDTNGKREGIEPKKTQEIIKEALKHLIFYSGVVKNFSFLNYKLPLGSRALRILCQKIYDGNTTNVIIEGRVIGLNCFEITVFTALQKNDFEPSDGQYVLELLGNENSILSHYTKRFNKLNEICSI